jgi:hypothetical protein
MSDFTFTRLTFSPVPALGSSADVLGLARRPSGELWVVLANSDVYVAAPGSLELRRLANLPGSVTRSTELHAVAVTSTEVLLLREQSLWRCVGACTTFTEFAQVTTILGVETGQALCSRGDQVFAITHDNALTGLWQYLTASTQFVKRAADLGVAHGSSCFISTTGELLVPGDDATLVVRGSAGGLTNESIDLQGHPAASWRWVTLTSSEGFVVGGGSGLRVALRQSMRWVDQPPDIRGAVLSVVLAAGDAVYAGAVANASGSAPTLYRWNGTAFVPLAQQPFATEITTGLAVSEHELYFAGASRTSGDFVVLRGTR